MAHVDDQRVARVLDALEAQHPGAQLLVNDPWSIYYLTGFYADMFERFCGVLIARDSEPPPHARSIPPSPSASIPLCAPAF